MKLSIIVPVYNMTADGKLNFCMDSLVNQKITDYEIPAVCKKMTAEKGIGLIYEKDCDYYGQGRQQTYSSEEYKGILREADSGIFH